MATAHHPLPVRMRIGDGPEQTVGEVVCDSRNSVVSVDSAPVRQLVESLRERMSTVEQRPSIGQIVVYVLSSDDADAINRRRDGSQVHVGNEVSAGDHYPMVITRVWAYDGVNGQVFLDGNDLYWTTSVAEGEDELTWHWPERV